MRPWISHDRIDVIHECHEPRPLLVSWPWNIDFHLTPNRAWVRSEDHNPVRQQDGLLNVVRYHQDAFSRKRITLPKVADFTAQVFRREHIQRAERLIHHQHIRFHHERPRETHPLPHASGQFFRISSFEAFEPYGAERGRCFFLADLLRDSARIESKFGVLFHG